MIDCLWPWEKQLTIEGFWMAGKVSGSCVNLKIRRFVNSPRYRYIVLIRSQLWVLVLDVCETRYECSESCQKNACNINGSSTYVYITSKSFELLFLNWKNKTFQLPWTQIANWCGDDQSAYTYPGVFAGCKTFNQHMIVMAGNWRLTAGTSAKLPLPSRYRAVMPLLSSSV